MERLSIFGGTGFVGSAFCAATTRPFDLVPRQERRPSSREVVYLISTTHNYHVFDDIQRDVDVNLKVLLEVLDHCREGGHTINFVSSWFVYGEVGGVASEESFCRPKGFYSITKHCAEELLISFCRTFGAHYRILRLCNVYGVGDSKASKQKNALQFLIEKMRRHEPLDLYYGGQFLRDYMHVSDVARAIDLVVAHGAADEVFNIGSGESVVFRDLIDQAKAMLHSSSELRTAEPPRFHQVVQVKDFQMSVRKLRELGFVAGVSIPEGLGELCR